MECYFECCEKIIYLQLYKKINDQFYFWLKRFCPNVKILTNYSGPIDMKIYFIESDSYNYVIKNNSIKIYGKIMENNSFIAKFVTQCFQKLLIEDDILIFPAACVSKNNQAILIIGDFWQGKTSVALNMSKKENINLISDNYVLLKKDNIIGHTKYISIRKENILNENNSIYNVNDRYFYENKNENFSTLKVINFLLPYINDNDNNIHIISKEESKWYLYQKFTRLLCGETILFDGKLPSPIFLNKKNSKKILEMIETLLQNCNINYASTSISNIITLGYKLLEGDEK